MGRGNGGNEGKEGGDESGGFADLVGDVRPLKDRSRHRPESKPRPTPTRDGGASASVRFRFPDADEPRLGAAHGVSDRVLRDLRRGDPPFEERIELHGLDREGARRHLGRNLESAVSRGLRCVLVVHGAGRSSPTGAVLRDGLPKWLVKPPCAHHVLAFAPAQRRDGGEGATYVLLRKSS